MCDIKIFCNDKERNVDCPPHSCPPQSHKLCYEFLEVKHLKSCKLEANDLCAQKLDAKNLFAEEASLNSLCCSGAMRAQEMWSHSIKANNLCARNASLESACISDLKAQNVNLRVKSRATATLANDILYNLGQPLNWNVILDDPSGNIVLAPFSYTVPLSGYYIVSFNVKSTGLSGALPITGVPVGLLDIFVNGNKLVDNQSSYLGFNNSQTANLSSLVLLNVGDVLSMSYSVLMLDPALGIVPYAGTVTIRGNGTFADSSIFSIHYLSSFGPNDIMCEPCPEVLIECPTVANPCLPFERCNEEDFCGDCRLQP